MTRAQCRLALIGVLAGGARLRFASLDFGLPLILRPDDQLWPRFSLSMWREFNHHYHHYPGLVFWVQMLALGAANSLGLALGWWNDWPEFEQHVNAHLGSFVLLGRWVNALFGWGAVWAAYGLARTLLPRSPSLFAATLLAVAPLAVREAHGITVDMPLTLFAMLCLTACVRIVQAAEHRHIARAALFAGLASACKWPALVIWAVPILTLWLRGAQRPRASDWMMVFGLPPLVFLILTPWIVTSPAEVWRDLHHQLLHAREGHRGVSLWPAVLHHVWFSFPTGLGAPSFALGVIGLWIARRKRAAWPLHLFFLLYLAAIGRGALGFARYVGPLLPVLCVFAALALWRIRNVRIRAALTTAALLWPLAASMQFLVLLNREDTRAQALRWILENIPAGTVVLNNNFLFGGVPLPVGAGGYDVYGVFDADLNAPVSAQERQRLGTAPAGAIVIRNFHGRIRGYDSDPETVGLLTGPMEFLAHFDPAEPDGSYHARWDPQDAWYIPHGLSWGIKRPGPLIKIYRLMDPVNLAP